MSPSWRCLEAGCGAVVTGDDDAATIAAAQEHMGTVHGSFELEDVVEAALEDRREPSPEGGGRA